MLSANSTSRRKVDGRIRRRNETSDDDDFCRRQYNSFKLHNNHSFIINFKIIIILLFKFPSQMDKFHHEKRRLIRSTFRSIPFGRQMSLLFFAFFFPSIPLDLSYSFLPSFLPCLIREGGISSFLEVWL